MAGELFGHFPVSVDKVKEAFGPEGLAYFCYFLVGYGRSRRGFGNEAAACKKEGNHTVM